MGGAALCAVHKPSTASFPALAAHKSTGAALTLALWEGVRGRVKECCRLWGVFKQMSQKSHRIFKYRMPFGFFGLCRWGTARIQLVIRRLNPGSRTSILEPGRDDDYIVGSCVRKWLWADSVDGAKSHLNNFYVVD